MSSNDKWMPLYVADYLGDTMHLTTLQHGAYVLLLMHYWRTGPLPNDPEELAAIVKLDSKTWISVWAKLSAFFTINGDGTLHQKRMDWERRRWTEISEKRRDAGKRGAEAKYRTRPTEGCGPIQPQSDAQPQDVTAFSKRLANATELPEPALSKPNGKPMANATPLPDDLPQCLPPETGNCHEFASVPLPLPVQKERLLLKGKTPVSPPAREGAPSEAAVRAARQQSAAEVSAMPAAMAEAVRSASAAMRNYALDGQKARQTINEQREDVATRTPPRPAYLSREQLQAARRQQLRVVA